MTGGIGYNLDLKACRLCLCHPADEDHTSSRRACGEDRMMQVGAYQVDTEQTEARSGWRGHVHICNCRFECARMDHGPRCGGKLVIVKKKEKKKSGISNKLCIRSGTWSPVGSFLLVVTAHGE